VVFSSYKGLYDGQPEQCDFQELRKQQDRRIEKEKELARQL
jgi:hypothetical protein